MKKAVRYLAPTIGSVVVIAILLNWVDGGKIISAGCGYTQLYLRSSELQLWHPLAYASG